MCDLGFCKCDPGWYGTDCSRRAHPDLDPDHGSRIHPVPSRLQTSPWLKDVVRSRHYNSPPSRADSEAEKEPGIAGHRSFLSSDLDLDLDPDADLDDQTRARRLLLGESPFLNSTANSAVNSTAIPRVRRRPYIYVYDLPPKYNSHILQYKIVQGALFKY